MKNPNQVNIPVDARTIVWSFSDFIMFLICSTVRNSELLPELYSKSIFTSFPISFKLFFVKSFSSKNSSSDFIINDF